MKTMDGSCARACANRSRTRAAPTPTNISVKSEPEMERNGTPASPAVALARSVLPVPGGPTRSAPRGSLAPSFSYFFGFLRNLTNSSISNLASSHPATSLNITLVLLFGSSVVMGALLTPKMPPDPRPPPKPPPPRPSPPSPDCERMRRKVPPRRRSTGSSVAASEIQSISVLYVTGRKSRGAIPSASCASSRRFSKPSMLPMLK
mmetsp:Transcript_1244/g.4621  ORF Transcript_1244/g.4621 Transcript_1244/m.4621 type:complete len:205 (+) Transcript_1244:1149-1763(+)